MSFSAAAAENFRKFFEKISSFREILHKKGKNDNWEPAHKELDEKNSGNWSWLLKILKNAVFIFLRQRRRLKMLLIA